MYWYNNIKIHILKKKVYKKDILPYFQDNNGSPK